MVLVLSLAALVAACEMDSSPDPTGDPAEARTAEAPVAEVPPMDPGPPVAPDRAPAGLVVPVTYRGVWDASAEACAASTSPTRWTIRDLQVSGLPGVAEVMTVAETGRRVTLETLFFAEGSVDGEPAPEPITLALGPGGDALSVTVFGQTDAKVRCSDVP